MPNPDVTPYYDLTLFDLDAQSVYQRALEYARVALPEFDPREGSLETIILQAVAIEVAELVTTINRLPGGIVQVLLALLGIDRSEGTRPTTTIRFVGNDANIRVVPAGIRLLYQGDGTGEGLLMATDEDLVLSRYRSVTSLTRDTNVVTATTSQRHGLSVGDNFALSQCGDESFNGAYEVTGVVDQYSFTYAAPGDDGVPDAFGLPSIELEDTPVGYGIVSATGLSPTAEFNDLSADTAFQILSVVPSVSSAISASPVIDGSDVETDEDFFARAIGTLQRLSSALVTPEHFVNYVASNPAFSQVYRVTAVDTTNADRVEEAGHLLVVVAPVNASASNLISGTDGGSAALGDSDFGVKDSLAIDLQRRSHAGLTVNVVDPLIVTTEVTVTFTPAAGVSYLEAATAVKSALGAYLNPDRWNWSDTIYANELMNVARNATFTSSDVELPAVARVAEVSIRPLAVTASTITPKKGGSYTRDSGSAEITATNNGISNVVGATLWIAIKPTDTTTWLLREIVSIGGDGDTLILSSGSDDEDGEWMYVGYVKETGTGDFVIWDPAPLVASSEHATNLAP